MLPRTLLILLLGAMPAAAQLLPPEKPGALPTGVILVKGAVPSASDRATPVPEDGNVVENSYRNRYFGMSWPLPNGWGEQVKGPPPSDSGMYVLTELASKGQGTVFVTAQDLFFGTQPTGSPMEMIAYTRTHLQPYYEVERTPSEMTLGKRRFARFDYRSNDAGLHWYVLATQARCHLVQFVYTGRDPKVLDALVHDLEKTSFGDDTAAPQCIANYAAGENVVSRVDPAPYTQKFNPIPVRLTIGTDGKVRHVHVLSAFPDQAKSITDALLQWRFKPRDREVETGVLFGGSGPATHQSVSTMQDSTQ